MPPPPDASTLTSIATESSRSSQQTRRDSHRTSSSLSPFFTRLDDHTTNSSFTSTTTAGVPTPTATAIDARGHRRNNSATRHGLQQKQQPPPPPQYLQHHHSHGPSISSHYNKKNSSNESRKLRPHLSDSLPFSSLSSSSAAPSYIDDHPNAANSAAAPAAATSASGGGPPPTLLRISDPSYPELGFGGAGSLPRPYTPLRGFPSGILPKITGVRGKGSGGLGGGIGGGGGMARKGGGGGGANRGGFHHSSKLPTCTSSTSTATTTTTTTTATNTFNNNINNSNSHNSNSNSKRNPTPTSSPHGSHGFFDSAANHRQSQQQQSQHASYHHYNHGSSSLSMVARRHLSKLSASKLPPRNPETESVLSEPCSYSTGAFVASDLWLVQRDVQPAEKAIVDKDRRRARARAAAAAAAAASSGKRGHAQHHGGGGAAAVGSGDGVGAGMGAVNSGSRVIASAPVSAPSSATASPSTTAARGRFIRSAASAPGPGPDLNEGISYCDEFNDGNSSSARGGEDVGGGGGGVRSENNNTSNQTMERREGPGPRRRDKAFAHVDSEKSGQGVKRRVVEVGSIYDGNSIASDGAIVGGTVTFGDGGGPGMVDLDAETPSSLLVSQFFSGAVSVSRPTKLADRDRSDFCADGTTFQRPLPERASARRFASSRQSGAYGSGSVSGTLEGGSSLGIYPYGGGGGPYGGPGGSSGGGMGVGIGVGIGAGGLGSGGIGEAGGSLYSSRTLRYAPRSTFERASQSHIPMGKRRVSTVRRVRWWFRRVSHRIRTEQDPP